MTAWLPVSPDGMIALTWSQSHQALSQASVYDRRFLPAYGHSDRQHCSIDLIHDRSCCKPRIRRTEPRGIDNNLEARHRLRELRGKARSRSAVGRRLALGVALQ